ncbi:MAG: HEAT repeat domain-containing protein, partial [Planctomycetota bacterium]
EALDVIRPGPEIGIPLMVKVLEEAKPEVTVRAVSALAARGEHAMPFLIKALEHDEAAYWACLVISEIGPPAKAAVGALTERLSDARPDVRREALIALAEIGEASAPAVGAVARALEDDLNRVAATYALGQMGRVPSEVEDKIERNVKSTDEVLRAVSVWALARLHPENKKLLRMATKIMLEGLKSDDPQIRVASARALFALDPDPEISRPLVEKALEEVDDEVLVGMLDAMAALGPRAVDRLVDALEHEKTRAHVAYILGQIGPEASPAVGALCELLDDDDAEVCREALFALAKIGPGAEAAVPRLIEALGSTEGPACYGVCFALGKIGLASMKGRAQLVENLQSDDASLAFVSAWALAQIDPESRQTAARSVAILAAALEEAHGAHRVEAAAALGRLGPLAKSAVPALKKATSDDDPHVRQAAAKALESVGE